MSPPSLNPSMAPCQLQVQTLLWPMKLFIIWAMPTFLIMETLYHLLKRPCPLTLPGFVDATSSAYSGLFHSFIHSMNSYQEHAIFQDWPGSPSLLSEFLPISLTCFNCELCHIYKCRSTLAQSIK